MMQCTPCIVRVYRPPPHAIHFIFDQVLLLPPPQMLAAAQGLPVVVQALLCTMSPEEASHRNSHGMSAADVAEEYHHHEIHELISKFVRDREEPPPLEAESSRVVSGSAQGGTSSGEHDDMVPPELPPWQP